MATARPARSFIGVDVGPGSKKSRSTKQSGRPAIRNVLSVEFPFSGVPR
jgi:hypothetical protein